MDKIEVTGQTGKVDDISLGDSPGGRDNLQPNFKLFKIHAFDGSEHRDLQIQSSVVNRLTTG
jgi:hypothetical protein